MRLAQLARKLTLKPSDIVEFLAERSIAIENNSNTKLSDEQVNIITSHFGSSAQGPETNEYAEQLTDQPDQDITLDDQSQTEVSAEPHDEIKNTEEEIKIEVIKAPKVDLPGLKVVGKIELPEPKKKEEPVSELEKTSQEENSPVNETPNQGQRQKSGRRPKIYSRPRKNPIALEREREEREDLRKKQEEARRNKELRTQRYYKKLDSVKLNKPSRKQREKSEEYETFDELSNVPDPPKSVLGKIWRWLKPPNTYEAE